MEFSPKLRSSLIQKWNNIGDSTQEDEGTTEFFDAVIGQNLIPSSPIFLLTILQKTREDEAESIAESSYGQYYEYVIIKSLGNSVKSEEIDIYLDYLSALSYHIFRKPAQAISPEEFSFFYKEQLIKMPHLPPHQDIIETLIKAETMTVEESSYRFKYKYMFYYFIARYLSKNMDLEPVKEEIRHICRELQNDDYANIVLFLTHHTKDPLIINEILLTTESIFSDTDPFSMEEDSFEINELIEELSRLGTKDRKLKELIAAYSSEGIQKILPQILLGNDQFVDENERIALRFDREEFSAAIRALKIAGQILRGTKTQEKDKFSHLALESFQMALRLIKAYKTILDQIKATILKSYEERSDSEINIEDLREEILIKEELYLSYNKIFIYYLRQTALCIGDSFPSDNKMEKQPDSMIEGLLRIATIAALKETKISISETENIIAKGSGNRFTSDIIRQTLSLYLNINAINSEDRENINNLIENSKEWGTGGN